MDWGGMEDHIVITTNLKFLYFFLGMHFLPIFIQVMYSQEWSRSSVGIHEEKTYALIYKARIYSSSCVRKKQ